MDRPFTYVVEHLDPELGPWSVLEYVCVARESLAAGARFLLSSVPTTLHMPASLAAMNGQGFEIDHGNVEDRFADRNARICLLDPCAEVDLSPDDADHFEIFLFGGILGEKSGWSQQFQMG